VALLTTTTTTAHGTVLPAATAVSASDTFANANGRTLIEVTNGGGSPTTVTFVTDGTYNITSTVTYPVADDAQTVTNGTSKVFGPFNISLLNAGAVSTGVITVTFSPTTSVTARVIELGAA
jgi:hypothetical protein